MEIDDCCWVQLYSESFEFNNGKHISNHMQSKCIHIDGE